MHNRHTGDRRRPSRTLGVCRVRRVLQVNDQRSRTRSAARLIVPSNSRRRSSGCVAGGCHLGCFDQINRSFEAVTRLRRTRISRGRAIVEKHCTWTGPHERRVGNDAAFRSISLRTIWKSKRLDIAWREVVRAAQLILSVRMLLPRKGIATRVKAKENQRQNGADHAKRKTDCTRIKKRGTSNGFFFHKMSGCASESVTRDFSAETRSVTVVQWPNDLPVERKTFNFMQNRQEKNLPLYSLGNNCSENRYTTVPQPAFARSVE